MKTSSWQITFASTIKNKISQLLEFYKDAFRDIDRRYNLVLEGFTFSPKFNQKVPIIRLIGSGAYIIEPAINILGHHNYKCHLHPDDLLKINALATEQTNSKLTEVNSRDISGEVYLSNGDNFNIYKVCLEDLDLSKLFCLSQRNIVALLEERGFYQGRKISQEIADLKKNSIIQKRNNIKLIDANS